MAKWNRTWKGYNAAFGPWPLGYTDFAEEVRLDPPSKKSRTTSYRLGGPRNGLERSFEWPLDQFEGWAVARLADVDPSSYFHCLVVFKGRHAHEPGYRNELWHFKNALMDSFNASVDDAIPLKLRVTWFVGRIRQDGKLVDLSYRRTHERQLEHLGLACGFGPVGLVDL